MEWQGIESAPKDGTVIDLWIETDDRRDYREADCVWFEDRWCMDCGYLTGVSPIEAPWPDGTGKYGNRAMRTATHWMPLPPSPHIIDREI